MAETIVLDPSEVATSRTQVDLTPWVSADGIDWGDAEIAAYMADQARGSSPVDFRVPNRIITIPLVLKNVGGTTFAAARTNVQAKAALFQREGGWLKRLTSTGGTVFADIVNATLKLGGGWGQAHRGFDTDAQLVVEALPDFYGAEVDLGDNVETTAAELVFTETGILGDYPGRVRIVVDDDSAQTQLGLLWSLRSRHYSAASTAATRYEAEALTTMDTATRAALTGASGGTVVTHGTVATNWTPVLSTNLQAGTFLTHTGTNRLFARYRTGGTAVQLRAVYDVGDLTSPVENTPVTTQTGGTAFYIADLGELRLDAGPVGTHRWQGHIQARGTIGTENVSLDKLWILNVDEGFGKITAPPTTNIGLSAYSARDEFNQSAGALAGKVAPVGGTWAGAGDADDFTVETTGKTAQRTAFLDSSTDLGRFAVSGVAAFAAQSVQVDVKATPLSSQQYLGVLARYIDVSNWMAGVVMPGVSTSTFYVWLRVAGTTQTLAARLFTPTVAVSVFQTVRLMVDTAGRWSFWSVPAGTVPSVPLATGSNSALATAGALASGKPGTYDVSILGGSTTRNYDNFAAWVPVTDAVVFPSRTIQIATDGVRRLDSTGTAYGPVANPGADLPRFPPSGLEGRTSEVFIKASRSDFDRLEDAGIDDISARVFYRPSWLFVP